MVAVAQFIPKDPEQKESVLAVLREHPELQAMILQANRIAGEYFPNHHSTLDTKQYDEWDPPVTLTIWADLPWDQFLTAVDGFTQWLAYDSNHDRELLFIMPMWNGPIESAK